MMKRVFFVGVALAVLLAAGAQATISVNLAEGSQSAPRDNQTVQPGEFAGALGYEAANWNNIQVDATGTALVDHTGAATGSVINFTVSNGWGDGSADTTPNGKIARGYFDDGDGAVSGDGIGVDIAVTNVPYSAYDVILLLSADSTDGNWATFRVNGAAQAGGPKLRYNTVNGFEIGRNAMLFTGVTGAVLDIHCPVRSGGNRGTISGFQIVPSSQAAAVSPADGARNVPVDQVISWAGPAAYAAEGYDVYLDPNELLVTNGDASVLKAEGITETTLGSLSLAYDTMYAWRVDALEPNIPAPLVHAGGVSLFTTERHPSQVRSGTSGLHIPAADLTVRNASFETVGDPGSSYGYEITDWYEEGGPFWELGTAISLPNCDGLNWGGMDQGHAFYQDIGVVTPGRSYGANMLVAVRSGWGTPADVDVTVSLYCGGSAANAADGVALSSFARLIDTSTAVAADMQPISDREFVLDAPLSVGNAAAGQTLWLHIQATRGRAYIDDVRMEQGIASNAAWNPSPERGAADVSTATGVLAWSTGVNIANDYQTDTSIVAHHVYAGVGREAVIAAGKTDASGIYRGRLAVGATAYDPAADGKPLPSDSRIYWRIDEELSGGAVVRGEIWSFDTELLLATITEQSAGAAAAEGGTATLSVVVDTVTPETYQWFKVVDGAGQEIPGATGPQLVIGSVSAADEGLYYCRITNNAGDIYSDEAFVVMKRHVGHWTFDGTLASEINSAHTGAAAVSRFVDGVVGQAWEFTGDPNIIVVENSVDDFNFYPQGYTVSAWVNTTQGGWGAFAGKELRLDGSGSATWRGFVLAHNGANAGTMLRQVFGGDVMAADAPINDGQWHLVTAAYDAVEGVARLYIDGRLNTTSAVDMTRAETNDQPLVFGAETETGTVAPYVGLLDDVQIWNYALDGFEAATLYTDVRTDETICVEVDPMDFDENCRVDLVDFAAFAASWLDCNLIPADLCF